MIKWRPIDELPEPLDICHTALVLCVTEESQYLHASLVNWSYLEACWEDDASGEPLELHDDADYFWCHETDVINEAIASIAKLGAGKTAGVAP